jgi:ABC-type uncharacterized transport system involved in gliding motility auxiliary subunit
MKLNSKSILQLKIQKIIFLVLFAGVIAASGWLTNFYSMQLDLTANKRHSLSQTSIDLLQALKGDITLHAYTTDDVTRTAIDEIIARYQREKDNFYVKHLHPDINIAEAEQDGIVMNKPFAFVVHYGNRMEHIESLSEQSISNALLRLSHANNQPIVFLSGHGERTISSDNPLDYNTLISQLADMGLSTQTVNLLEQSLPAETRTVVIAAPKHPYLQGELEQISRFLDNGGNLLWLTEPGDLQGLEPLATSFGIQMQQGVVIDNNSDLRRTLNIQHPAFIPVTEYYPHEITQTIRYNTLFPTARGISPLTHDAIVNRWKPYALFGSLAKSWSESESLDQDSVSFDSESGDIAGPITIAVALVRDDPTGAEQRVIITGDSDFLSDRYIGAGANLNLGLNMINWLVSDNQTIAIEPLSSPDTSLVLSDTELAIIAFGFFLVIPVGLIATGFIVWHRRKSR